MWHLAGMSLWVCYIINAVVHLLVLWLCEEARLSLTAAGLYSSLTFATSLVGKVGFGAALDRPDRHRHALASCALLTAGSALMSSPVRDASGGLALQAPSTHPQLVAFAVCFGLGYGGSFTLVQSRAAHMATKRACFQCIYVVKIVVVLS